MAATFITSSASTPGSIARPYTSVRAGRPAGVLVVVPSRLADRRPTTTVYVRRRVVAALVFVVVALTVWFGAGQVLANRGGAPASTPTVRPAASYVVQPGDTMWSIAAVHHGAGSHSDYVDALIAANGGADLAVGQVIVLP
ncbi:MAG TPA: hypothetical protein DCR14_07530 [Acidimicrobiaceae bacterium]|nr:hypothetical protein [Acidimicrobiaceae bacterium]